MESRFGATPFGTVPKTPTSKAMLKNLKSVFGSPPGLSHTEKRRARDACMTPDAWGNLDALPTGDLSSAAGKGLAHNRLAKMKARAALLKDLKGSQQSTQGEHGEEVDDVAKGDTSEPAATPEEVSAVAQNCRFMDTSFGTTPSTPIRKEAPASPPGLSSKSMRQSRDVTKVTAPASVSWGNRKSDVLTISPIGKPMSPPAGRAAKQRAARDAMTLGWGVSMPAITQAPGVPR